MLRKLNMALPARPLCCDRIIKILNLIDCILYVTIVNQLMITSCNKRCISL